eukprot:SAG22_NODE_2190_length_2863_cov_1.672214_2_plen_150_part_00
MQSWPRTQCQLHGLHCMHRQYLQCVQQQSNVSSSGVRLCLYLWLYIFFLFVSARPGSFAPQHFVRFISIGLFCSTFAIERPGLIGICVCCRVNISFAWFGAVLPYFRQANSESHVATASLALHQTISTPSAKKFNRAQASQMSMQHLIF